MFSIHRNKVRRFLTKIAHRYNVLREFLYWVVSLINMVRYKYYHYFPNHLKPLLKYSYIAITSNCNLHCDGCEYGSRNFMPHQNIDLNKIVRLLDGLVAQRIYRVRFYGGEPLLRTDLKLMVAHAVKLGISPTISTNGFLLRNRINELFDAGLRNISISGYGLNDDYDRHVHTQGAFDKFEEGISYARQKYGNKLQLSYNILISKVLVNQSKMFKTLAFSLKYRMSVVVNLVHYDFPYFNSGENRRFLFGESDRGELEKVALTLIKFKKDYPELLSQPIQALRSIPDWLIKEAAMEVPCLRGNSLWFAPNGNVMPCQKSEILGNIYTKDLNEIVLTRKHISASQDIFQLKCSRCHVSFGDRVMAHWPTRRKYGQQMNWEAVGVGVKPPKLGG